MVYKIVFEIEPVPASRPRVGKWGAYYNQTYAQFIKDMAWHMKSVKKLMLKDPLKTEITFWKKIPKSTSKKETELMHNTYCVSNVDLDNLEKSVYDAMNGHVYEDDKQIVEHLTRKKLTKDKARIEITLQKINE
jgi:Holliday junction resolvase RusA-like endonuclease